MNVNLGINSCFALKRWPRPADWASVVRNDLGLDLVELSLDLIEGTDTFAGRRDAIERTRCGTRCQRAARARDLHRARGVLARPAHASRPGAPRERADLVPRGHRSHRGTRRIRDRRSCRRDERARLGFGPERRAAAMERAAARPPRDRRARAATRGSTTSSSRISSRCASRRRWRRSRICSPRATPITSRGGSASTSVISACPARRARSAIRTRGCSASGAASPRCSCSSPTGSTDHHWAFTAEHNASGIIEPGARPRDPRRHRRGDGRSDLRDHPRLGGRRRSGARRSASPRSSCGAPRFATHGHGPAVDAHACGASERPRHPLPDHRRRDRDARARQRRRRRPRGMGDAGRRFRRCRAPRRDVRQSWRRAVESSIRRRTRAGRWRPTRRRSPTSLGLAPFHLAGVSMGGLIAQEYALAYPNDLRSVVLANTYAKPDAYTRAAFDVWGQIADDGGHGRDDASAGAVGFQPALLREGAGAASPRISARWSAASSRRHRSRRRSARS